MTSLGVAVSDSSITNAQSKTLIIPCPFACLGNLRSPDKWETHMEGGDAGDMALESPGEGHALDDPPRAETASNQEDRRWSIENWLIIALFFSLTVLGVALSTGFFELGVIEESTTDDGSVRVPVFIYLYASLGALGYIFTRLITQLDAFVGWGDIERLVRMALRIPAAWILAAGVYLFLPLFHPGGDLAVSQLAAGVSFLVGLYVNVAFKSLGGLAERLLGRSPR